MKYTIQAFSNLLCGLKQKMPKIIFFVKDLFLKVQFVTSSLNRVYIFLKFLFCSNGISLVDN